MIQKNNTSPYRSLTGPAGLITVLSFDLDLHAATTTAQSNKYLGRYEVLVDIRRVYTVYWSGKDEKWASACQLAALLVSASRPLWRSP